MRPMLKPSGAISCNRVDAIGEPLPEWDAQRYLDNDRIKTQFGGFLKDLYRFYPQ